MKRVIEVDEQGGIESLLGERVTLMCGSYFYTGTLSGVDDRCAMLTDAAIVYETGPFNEAGWKDAQSLGTGKPWYVMLHAIESFGILK